MQNHKDLNLITMDSAIVHLFKYNGGMPWQAPDFLK